MRLISLLPAHSSALFGYICKGRKMNVHSSLGAEAITNLWDEKHTSVWSKYSLGRSVWLPPLILLFNNNNTVLCTQWTYVAVCKYIAGGANTLKYQEAFISYRIQLWYPKWWKEKELLWSHKVTISQWVSPKSVLTSTISSWRKERLREELQF